MARGALSDYAAGIVYDAIARGIAPALPGIWYLALFNANPGSDGTGGTELTSGGYYRTAITFGAGAVGVGVNNIDVEFPEATAAWSASALGFAVFDDPTGGNQWFQGVFASATAVTTGIVFIVPSGTIQLDTNQGP